MTSTKLLCFPLTASPMRLFLSSITCRSKSILTSTKPAPIHTSNYYMGGIDLNDQMRSYYQSGHTGKKWWLYIFWYFLDVAICNASVVEWPSPHTTGTWNRRTLLHFKLDLAKQLIGEFYGSKRYPGQKSKFSPVDNTVALENLWPSSCIIHRSQEILCPLCKTRSSKSVCSYSRDHLAAIAVEWTFATLGVSYSQKTASCNHPLCHTYALALSPNICYTFPVSLSLLPSPSTLFHELSWGYHAFKNYFYR